MSSPPFFSLNGSPSPKTSPAEAVPPAAGAARRGLFGQRQPHSAPVCEEADEAVSLDDQIVNGSLRLLAPSSSETLRLHLHQGLALLRRMTEVMSPLYPQPESTLLQWLQQPYDHFCQIQTHALQKVARRLGSELGLESCRNPPFSESLATYLFSIEELDQLLIDRGILKEMPVYAGLWSGS